jgi:hypothetical protein
MSKHGKSGNNPGSKGKGMGAGSKGFQPRNLANTNPLKEQFEPTPASPIRQHKKMAGMG